MKNNNVQSTIGQVLSLAHGVAEAATDRQRDILISQLNALTEEGSRSAVIPMLLAMADENYQFDWKEIYSMVPEEDEDGDEADSAVKYAQAWMDGTFPIHVMHAEVLTDEVTCSTLKAYIERVAGARVSHVIYDDSVKPNDDMFLSYRPSAGIACSPQRTYRGTTSAAQPIGHFAISGVATLSALYAQSNVVINWAREMLRVLRRAEKKNRFSAAVVPMVDRLIEALESVRKIKLVSGDGYELRLMSSAVADELNAALDALDGLARAEIREALIRHAFICPPALDAEPSKKVKNHIKEHGAVLTADLLKKVMKEFRDDGSDGELWESVAVLDIVGIARQYIRNMRLVGDNAQLNDNWRSWSPDVA